MITDYNHLNIGKYLEIQEIAKDESRDELDKQLGILSILTDMDEDELLHMPIVEYKALAEKSRFLTEPINVPQNIASTYDVEGWHLVPTTDIRKMTTAQYIDFQTFSQMGEVQLVEVLSCFLIPKGMTYNEGYDIVELQRVIRDNISMPHCLALSAFFLSKFNRSMRGMLIYCKWITRLRMPKGKEKTETLKQIESLMADIPNGDGLNVLMP